MLHDMALRHLQKHSQNHCISSQSSLNLSDFKIRPKCQELPAKPWWSSLHWSVTQLFGWSVDGIFFTSFISCHTTSPRQPADYKMTHFRFFCGSGGSSAARMASSKTFFRPFCVRAEHSTYFTAFSSLASFSPCS